ncbi:right-handed parallel beta-helix repeat-containing protein, partial [Candidatus Bathyarchaeota archaeon]|nr:right-handed parallel beta-helix repeat-containing protein [Candidatus Bathyarchaeota archaeon]
SASYDLDGSIIQFVWDFGDGTIGTGVTAFHTYSQAGQYSVSLTATDDSSLSNVICRTLTVRPYTTGPVHNIDTGLNYATIQEAIDADETEDGHTIFVDPGVYHENVRVTKSLKLIGEDSFTTIIDGKGGRVLSIFGDPFHPLKNVTVKGFTMMNGSLGIFVGMMWDPQTNTWGRANIIDNIVKDNIAGIIVDSGRKNVLKNNDMSDNIYNLCLRAREEQDIDTTNTINGKPVYYLINRSNLLMDPTTFPNIGYLALVNCTNVTVRNLILSENGQGILLGESRNITLFNNEITNNVYGVDASAINQSQFVRNTIYNNGLGMMLRIGNFNNITKNKFENNTSLNVPSDAPIEFRIRLREGFGGDSGALSLLGVTSSAIIGNTIKNNDEGIDLGRCSGNTLRNNIMTANTLNFGVNPYVSKFSYFVNDIDASNTVNGKPMIWWINQHNKQVPLNAGYVAVVNSTNISIKNLNVSNNRQGILIVSSNNTMISGNTISTVAYGIAIYQSYKQIPGPIHDSINSTVFNNTVTASGAGILLRSGWNHTVSFNSLSNNLAGIVVRGGAFQTMILGNTVMNSTYPGPYNVPHESWWWEITAYGSTGIIIESPLNTICENTVAYNDIGMAVGLVTMIGNNAIYHNNFVDNLYQQLWTGPSNILDNGYPSGGNYWSDHVTVDDCCGINQDELGSDGIVDEPYIIDANNRDNYPLVEPWTPLPRTIDELKTKVEEFGLEGEIDNRGIVRSLIAKLSVAQKLVDKGKIDEAKSILEDDFIPQVQNLSEIRITAEAAEVLVKSAEYIVSHL